MQGRTNGYKMALTARERIGQRQPSRELATFAGSFPLVVQSYGLAHAIALATARGHDQYIEDLAAVLAAAGHAEGASAGALTRATLEHSVADYVQLTCDTLQAAVCLKESVEEASRWRHGSAKRSPTQECAAIVDHS